MKVQTKKEEDLESIKVSIEEREEWIKGPDSENDQAEYWLCIRAAKHIRENPEQFIGCMREAEKKNF